MNFKMNYFLYSLRNYTPAKMEKGAHSSRFWGLSRKVYLKTNWPKFEEKFATGSVLM